MKVKKIVVNDMPEAMTKIKEELGQNAVILNSRSIEKGGFLGFFTKKKLEVTAAIDPDLRGPKEKFNPRQPAPPASDQRKSPALSQEIDQLRSAVNKLQSQSAVPKHSGIYPGPLNQVASCLEKEGVQSTYIQEVMEKLTKQYYREDNHHAIDLKDWTQSALTEILAHTRFQTSGFETRYVNVVGPTGVGKTTTLAKMASRAVIHDQKKVAFITTDTYRIAAVEQLKTYAKILNVPVEVAYTIDDFSEAQRKLLDYDLIFIDSAGRNFRDADYVEQLIGVIDFSMDMQTHLVLALTSKYEDMADIIEQFKLIQPDRIIFTKWDETSTYGAIVNVMKETALPISYITTGQDVPDDLEVANKQKLIDQLVRKLPHG